MHYFLRIVHALQEMPGDPMEPGSKSNKVVMDIRKRKGMKVELPDLSDYLDKL